MNNSVSSKQSALKFFLLVFIISVPFWLIGDIAEQKLPLPFNLPVGALVLACPMIAALILIYRENGSNGVKQLLKRSFDFKRIKRKIWYIPIFFLMPCIIVLEYGLMKLMEVPIPNFQFPVLMVPIFFVIFFIGGIGEEIGWTGYATDPLQGKENALKTSIILGIVWTMWHITPWLQAHYTPLWVTGQSATSILLRVLIVWIYNNTGKSVFAAIAFHATTNVSELVLFPIYGSYYDPVIAFIFMAVTVAIVIFLWGPKTLARYRYARSTA
ncbi:MAG TPA: type II CAAX endopeptidase family protein [Methanosarcina sp.]|nr:type II CAAX endopeptidase family protein [Methanosarcina sp.]